MRRNKRTVQSPNARAKKRHRTDSGAGSSSRRGRASTRGRSQAESERQTGEDSPPRRRHVLIEDDEEDDAQRNYEEEGGSFVEDIYIPPPFKKTEVTETKERLVIEKITCVNFKSYGGIKEMGPFHKSFSAIVGPNGNGKSNIIDAMLFVFGYRAAKIRCKKLSVLIHKSELLPSLPYCSVTVHFQQIFDNGEDDEYTVIPNSQIKVTRRANKDNSSTYWLNEKKVKFQDVADFLKSNGIDIVHNRFLILQGEVESISQMPPKQTPSGETGLLEFLEDIIGSKRYLRSLVNLENRVETLNEQRLERLQIVDLVEKERKSLDEPAKKAKEYLANVNQKIRHEFHMGQFKCYEKQGQLEEAEGNKSKIEQSVKEVLSRLNEISATNTARKVDFERADNEHKQLESEYKKQKKIMDTAENDFAKNTETLQRTNEQRKKIIKDITKKEEELVKLDEIPVSHESEIKKLSERNEELTEQISAEQTVVDKECSKLQVKINSIVKEKEGVETNYLKLKKVKDQKKRENDSLLSDLNLYKQQEKVETEKFETMKVEIEQLKESIQQKEKNARKSNENNRLQESLNKKTEEFEVVENLEKVKKVELVKMQDSLEEMRSVLDGLNVQDETYKMFLAEKAQGRLPGLYGKLKDLATIDEKYNVAITMATNQLDYWICDEDSTGSACIATLKSKGLQAQTFVCLSRIGQSDKHNVNVPFRPPPRSHRLFDLLKFSKPEFRPAFYKALRNTLVTDDLNIASEIAYGQQRHRVVTLKGELIDSSGSMSGGGRPLTTGKMNSRMAACLGSSFTQEQYAELKKQRDKCSKEYEELCSKKRSLEQEIRNIMSELQQHSMVTQNFQNDLNSLKSQMPLKEVRLKEQESRWKKSLLDPKVLKGKEKDYEKSTALLQEATEPCEAAEKEISKISVKLKELEVDAKAEIKKKLNKISEMKIKVASELNKFIIELKNYKKNRIKVIEKIESLKNEKEKLQKQMEKTNDAKKRIEIAAVEIKDTLNKLEISVKESNEKLIKLKENAHEFREEENKLSKEKIKAENELKIVRAVYDKIYNTIKNLEEILAGMDLKQIPGEVIEPITPLLDEDLENFDVREVERQIANLKHKLGKEEPNLEILDVYQEKWNEFYKVVEDLNAITARRDKFRAAYISTMSERLLEFMSGFATISTKVKELFRMISMGGDAELEILDCFDPFASGIEFTVRPARKTWKQISYLSGGEKTLSSLALVFALHYFKPSPFYVMDEIDAALDFKNVSIIANYIKERTKLTQFIIISLRSNMFELADSLLGVYKVDNMSYSIHLGVGKLIKQLKKKFEDAGKPFPLVSEYSNIPTRKKIQESHSPELFVADITNIPDAETDSNLSQPQQTPAVVVDENYNPASASDQSSELLFTTPISSARNSSASNTSSQNV